MPRYIWNTEEGDEENFAEYDAFGGGIIFYLNNIKKDIEKYDLFDHSGLYQQLIAQLLVHEDLHQGITEAGGVDTTGEQDHNFMDWIKSALDDTTN